MIAVTGDITHGRKAIETRAMPKPVRPMTKLASAMTTAPTAQARVTVAFYAGMVAGGSLAAHWRRRFGDGDAWIQALGRGVRTARAHPLGPPRRGDRLHVRDDLRSLSPVDGRPGSEPVRVVGDRRPGRDHL